MELVEIAHTMDRASFPALEHLQKSYGWSNRTHRIFERMFGLQSTSLHPDMSLEQSLSLSATRLARQSPTLIGNVDYLVYCHALNTSLPFEVPVLQRIARKAFGTTPEVLSVTHGSCASAIMAMQLIERITGGTPANVVILTGEKCFFELLNYADNNGLFGEIASAVHIRTGTNRGLHVAATTAGVFDGVYKPLAKADKDVAAAYDQTFIPTMTQAVQRVLDQAEIGPDDIDLILPTHLSPFTFNRVAAQLNIPGERVVKQNLSRIGHCFCGDLFINLDTWSRESSDVNPAPSRPANILSFAAGMTGSYAAILLKKDPS